MHVGPSIHLCVQGVSDSGRLPGIWLLALDFPSLLIMEEAVDTLNMFSQPLSIACHIIKKGKKEEEKADGVNLGKDKTDKCLMGGRTLEKMLFLISSCRC